MSCYPPGYEDPSVGSLLRCLLGCQALKVNTGGACKRKCIRITPDLRYIVWTPSKRGLGANGKFGACPSFAASISFPSFPFLSLPLPLLLLLTRPSVSMLPLWNDF